MKNGVGFSPLSSLTKLLTILTIIGTTDAALAQNLANNQKNKDGIENTGGVKNNINIRNTEDPIGYAFDNIEKYYPDMKTSHPEVAQHIAKLRQEINGTWGKIKIKEANKIFRSIQRSNSYSEKDIIKFIISTSESDVIMKGTTFSETYRTDDYTTEEETYYNTFNKIYTDRFNAYEKEFNENLTNLQKRIKEIEENIKNKEENTKRNIEETIKILETFSVEDILNNKQAYETVKEIKKGFEEEGWKTSPHVDKLFSIIK